MNTLPSTGSHTPLTAPGKRLAARSTIMTGVLIVLFFFGAGGFWAVNASIDSAVIAPGELIVEGNRTRVQHLEGGIIADIKIRDGHKVKVGDSLILLENVRARAQVQALKAEYFEALGRSARLRAERSGLTQIDFPDPLIAAADDLQVAEIAEMQLQLFHSRRRAFKGQKDILASRVPQYHSMIDGLDAQLTALQTQAEIFAEELAVVEELFDKGIERRPRLLQLRRNVAVIQGEIGDLKEKRAQTLLAISELEMRLIDLDDSRFAAIDDELTPLLSRLIDIEDRLFAAEDQLSRTTIRAPVDGVVVGLAVHNSGAVIDAGAVILSIVPEFSPMIVHARINPIDVDMVTAGLTAQVVLSAFKQSDVKPLDALVERVSADRLEDERTGETYFEVVLSFPSSLGAAELPPLVSGMPAEVYINTGTRSPLDYFMQPLRDSFRRAMRES